MIAIVPPHGICFVTGKPLASHRTFTIRYANVQNKQTRCSRAVERKSSYWVNVPGTTLQLTTMLPTKQRPRGVAMFIVKIDLKLQSWHGQPTRLRTRWASTWDTIEWLMIPFCHCHLFTALDKTRIRLHPGPAPCRAAADQDEEGQAVPEPLPDRHFIP